MADDKVDYQSNAKKVKEKKEKEQDKPLEPVVTNTVLIKKRSVGRRFKDFVVQMDFKSVSKYVFMGVMIPAAKSMIFDAGHEVMRRVMFPDSRGGPGQYPGPGAARYNYQTPVSRPYSQHVPQGFGPRAIDPAALRLGSHFSDDIILVDQRDAEAVLTRMFEVLEQVQVVTVRDLKELLGRPSSFVDDGYGWVNLQGARVISIPQGYMIELPQAQSLR